MHVKIENFKGFLDDLRAINKIVDEVRIRAEPDGLKIKEIDNANVCVVDYFYPKSNCIEYESDDRVAGINLENLIKLLKLAKKNDKIEIKTQDDSMILTLSNDGAVKGRNFTFPLIELENELPKSDLDFKTEVTMQTEALKTVVEEAETISDAIIFSVTNGVFKVKTENATTKYNTEIEAENKGMNASSRYPIDYLKRFLVNKKDVKDVKLEFNTDYPLRMTFSRADKSVLKYLLAPRVEE